MKKNKHITFIRFGNLSVQKHDIPKNYEERGYHTPPTVNGIYAFPQGFVETYLIGGAGAGSLQNGRYSKFKNKNGKVYRIKGNEFENLKKRFSKNIARRLTLSVDFYDWWETLYNGGDLSYEEACEIYNEQTYDVWIENKPIHFSYNGLIWHHLFNSESPQLDKEYPNYIKIVDTWVLTDMPTYIRCLNTEIGRLKYNSAFDCYCEKSKGTRKVWDKGSGFNYGGHKIYFSKDHFEVYIENIQNDNKLFKKY